MKPIEVTSIVVVPIKEPQGKLRAMVRLALNEQFQLTQLRLYEGSNGLFVGYPIDTSHKGDNYRQIFYPLTRELRDDIDAKVIAKYFEVMSTGKEAQ